MSSGKGLFFNGVSYSAEDMVSYLGNICSDGIVMRGDSLKPVSLGGLSVRVLGGSAYLQGYGYVLGDEGCDFTAAAGTRTDLIVLELNTVNKTLDLVLKQNQDEPLSNELGIAKLNISGETMTITDIRVAATLQLGLAGDFARTACGTYTGNGYYDSLDGSGNDGTYGYVGSVTLTFDVLPKIIFVTSRDSNVVGFIIPASSTAAFLGFASGISNASATCIVSGSNVSWSNTRVEPDMWLNNQNSVYDYIGIY